MEINWLTVAAQIVNFLILVWLLKRFLYGPIIKAMDQREADMAAAMQDAEDKAEEAQAEGLAYHQRTAELEDRREEIMQLASSEAADERERLLGRARKEVEQAEHRWHHSLDEERQAFGRELRRRAGEQVCAVARRALADLADADLERQVTATFLRRLQALDGEERDELADALTSTDEHVVITSAFELPQASREELVSAVQETFDASPRFDFTTAPEVMCGIELRAGGRKLSWSLDSYLDDLEEELAELVAREVEEDQ